MKNPSPVQAAIILASSAVARPGHTAPRAGSRLRPLPIPVVTRFENFGEKDGLPSHKVHCVLKASDGVCGSAPRTACASGRTTAHSAATGPEDGLSHLTVLSIAEDPATGDLWIATLQGLTRFSGGKFTAFTQTNSGLPNNVVYGVAVATAPSGPRLPPEPGPMTSRPRPGSPTTRPTRS
jgi:hypothetical protein